MNYLPSKKVAIFVTVLIILTVGGFWYFGTDNKKPAPTQPQESASSSTDTLFGNKNSEQIDETLQPLVTPQIANGDRVENFDIKKYFKVYTAKDIKTTKNNDKETLYAYGLSIAKALEPYSVARENEVQTLIRAVDSKNLDDIASITNSREVKEGVLNNLLTIKVPTEATTVHLALINSVGKQVAILKNMEKAFSEPITALRSATYFPGELSRFYSVGVSVNEFFRQHQIKFDQSEKIEMVTETIK